LNVFNEEYRIKERVIVMATSRRTVNTGRQRQNRTAGQMYVYGNVAAKPSYEPQRRTEEPQKKSRTRNQSRRKLKKAQRVNSAYVLFLSAAAIFALVICVNYIKLQSRITSRAEDIAALQEELANLKEENNTRYNSVMDSVNLDEIRKKAEESLGMVYASADQVVGYTNGSSDYVKQYENIPEDGVIAQSDKNTD